MKVANDIWVTEWIYQIKTTLKCSENRKPTNLGILEADTIRQVDMKEKIRKNILGELENYSRHNYLAETLSKNKYLVCNPR